MLNQADNLIVISVLIANTKPNVISILISNTKPSVISILIANNNTSGICFRSIMLITIY